MRIELGVDSQGRSVAFDLDTLIRTRLLLQASSGGGKSWTTRRILEQSHGKVQHLVFDPEGEFSTLREKFDYVLVGKGGEAAADPRTMPLLIRRVMELGVSAIIDLYEMPIPQRRVCVKVALDALVNLPKELWHPCVVVVDEGHEFAPEAGKGGRDVTSLEAMTGLTSRGRKRQFCAVFATQRIGKMSKDATAELRNRLIGLAVEDIDRKRAGEELGLVTKEDQRRLRELEPGQFYAIGPALRVGGRPARELVLVTIGAVQTREPQVGTRAAPPPPPREKVLAILSKLADLPKEAAEEAQTVAGLRRQVHEQRQEIARLRAGAPQMKTVQTIEKVKRVEVPVLTGKDAQYLQRTAQEISKSLEPMTKEIADLGELLRGFQREIVRARSQPVLPDAKRRSR